MAPRLAACDPNDDQSRKQTGYTTCDLVENRLCKRGNVIAAWNFEVDIFLSIALLQGGLIRVLL